MIYIIIFFLLLIIFYNIKENFTQPVFNYNEYILNDGNNNYLLIPFSLLHDNIKIYLLDNNLINNKYNIIDRLKSGIINDININKKPLNDILYAININDIQLFVNNNYKLIFNYYNKPIIYDNKDNYNIIENSDIYILDSNISISNYTYPFNIKNNLLNNKLDIQNYDKYNFELNNINIDNKNIYDIKLSSNNTNIKLIKKYFN